MRTGVNQANRRAIRHLAAALLIMAFCGARPAGAVLIIGTDDVNGNPTGGQNLSAPTGALAGSGWDLEGTWQTDYTGTPIAPNYFITAAHLGGSVGDTFVFNGVDFTTTAAYTPPDGSDLEIWKVSGTFSSYATIDTSSNVVGQQLVVFGRSGGDGPTPPHGTTLNGWQWSPTLTGALSWGTNTVGYQGTLNGLNGQFIGFAFDKSLGSNTGAIAAGDSGGGVFIQNNGVWTLAGVNSVASGPYNTQPGTAPATAFNASLYDSRGLYFDGSTQLISGATAVPSASYATSLGNEIAWIASVTGVPEPGALVLLGSGLAVAWPLALRQRSKRDRVEQDA